MSAGVICSRTVVTVSPAETIRTAAGRMAEHDVGTLIVVERDGRDRPVGVVTDRDLALRCIAGRLDPETTPVSQVMTGPVTSVGEDTPIDEAISRMAATARRRLVITGDGGRVVGILSLDDVLDLMFEEGKSVARLLEKQQPHVTV
jgi:CBS domain-containing protein